jgi:hypothetical protein
MGKLPEIYKLLGIKEDEIKTNSKTLFKAMGIKGRNKHNVKKETIDNLISYLYNPEAVFKSLKTSLNPEEYVVVIGDKALNGKQIVVILSPSKEGKGFVFIPSIYERNKFDNFVKSTYLQEKILYIRNKGSELWGQLQLLPRHGKEPLMNNILDKYEIVKKIKEKNIKKEKEGNMNEYIERENVKISELEKEGWKFGKRSHYKGVECIIMENNMGVKKVYVGRSVGVGNVMRDDSAFSKGAINNYYLDKKGPIKNESVIDNENIREMRLVHYNNGNGYVIGSMLDEKDMYLIKNEKAINFENYGKEIYFNIRNEKKYYCLTRENEKWYFDEDFNIKSVKNFLKQFNEGIIDIKGAEKFTFEKAMEMAKWYGDVYINNGWRLYDSGYLHKMGKKPIKGTEKTYNKIMKENKKIRR